MSVEFKDRVLSLLDELGIVYRWVDHPAVFTVSESMNQLEGKRPTKNLVLQDKTGRCVMVVMDGITRLDAKKISAELGVKKLTFAKPEMLMETLGVTPGSVSIFGLLNDSAKEMDVVLDSNILGPDEIGFHPNDNTASILIPGNSLEKIVVACGHTPHIMDLSNHP